MSNYCENYLFKEEVVGKKELLPTILICGGILVVPVFKTLNSDYHALRATVVIWLGAVFLCGLFRQ